MSSETDVRGVTPSLNALKNAQTYNKVKKHNKSNCTAARGCGAKTDSVNVDLKDVYKSLTVLGDEIVGKLDEMLKDSLPEGGIRALKPEDHTPEATASRIADGTLGLFAAYQKQNPELEGEELLNSFMGEIRSGIKTGYEDAMGILDGLGAFQFDGVKDGIGKTMSLVEEKLKAFEDAYRESLKKQAPAATTEATATPAPGPEVQ